MQNRLLFFLFLLCLTSGVYSQNNPVSWGVPINNSRRSFSGQSQIAGFIGQHNDKMYYLSFDNKGPAVDVFNDSLSLISSKELPLDYKDKKMQYQGIFKLNDHLVLLSSFYNQKHKKYYLFYQNLSLPDLKSSGLTKIMEINDISRKATVYFDHDKSVDDSKIIIYSAINIQGGPVKYGFKVFNDQMKELWSKNIADPNDILFFVPRQIEVTTIGDVVFSGYVAEQAIYDSDRKYHILLYENGGEKMMDYALDLEDKIVKQMTFLLDRKDKMHCAGFYSEPDEEQIKGVFHFKMDPIKQEVTHKSYNPFLETFISGRSDTIQINTADKELLHYRIRDLKLDQNEEVILIAEEYYVQIDRSDPYTFQSVRSSRSVTNYFYNDVLLFHINNTGDLDWQTCIEKRQHSTDDGGYFSSFAAFSFLGNITIVYNENASDYYTESEFDTISRAEKRKYFLMAVDLNQNGTYNKEIVSEQFESGVRARPKISEQITADRAIIYGIWNKKQRLGSFELNRKFQP